MNPLIDKFEELYGEKPEPKEEPEEDIPTTQITEGEIVLDKTTGSVLVGHQNQYLSITNANTPAYISNGTTSYTTLTGTGYKRGFEIPNQTPVEQQFCKVMQNVADGKATVSSISADIDTAFTGFGGQIRYTVEIVGKYP